ncbi:MAG: exopolyphosphatase [Acidimicrobiales bacterium]|jgi:exopolyphosphatase / guanosine-5'-triphosphate,3'-diphosphate pyrophosphatase
MRAGGPVAAVDLGTNSTRLLVIDANGQPLERLMRITRLGEGVDGSGRLAEEAMRRTTDVLAEFAKVMGDLGVGRARATATSAARDAENADVFARRVAEVIGVVPEVLDGNEEARLTYLGATSELDPDAGPYLVIDVGGGSTELVGGSPSGLHAVSLEMGCVRVTERFLEHDPPLREELDAARVYVRRLVAGAVRVEPGLAGAARLIGVAGTVSALVRLEQGIVEYDRSRVHHAVLSLSVIERLLGELAALSVARRVSWPALEAERADVIIGGMAVLTEAMAVLGFDALTASESDLLDGVAAELLTR